RDSIYSIARDGRTIHTFHISDRDSIASNANGFNDLGFGDEEILPRWTIPSKSSGALGGSTYYFHHTVRRSRNPSPKEASAILKICKGLAASRGLCLYASHDIGFQPSLSIRRLGPGPAETVFASVALTDPT